MTPMEKAQTPPDNPRLGFLEITILVLSVYVLGAMLAQVIFQIPPAVSDLLERIDSLICVVFLIGFALRSCCRGFVEFQKTSRQCPLSPTRLNVAFAQQDLLA